MSNCRTGCRTQDHGSYADCLKAASPATTNSTQSRDALYGREAERDAISREYRAARAQGIQPASTQLADIRQAVAVSQKVDSAVEMRN